MKFIFFSLLFVILNSCVQQTATSKKTSNLNCPPGQTNCSGPGDGGIGGSGGTPIAKVEIRHIVDPFTGTYQKKLTIPKNYHGLLYISGLNFQALKNKHVYVRFKIGMAKEQITYEATLGQGQGITPATTIDVLILDLTSPGEEGKRFSDLKILYDLYDYNDYDFTSGDSAVTNNLNVNLFCRGLYLEDDSTFQGSGSCSSSTSQCRYAYAKVLDKGLMKDNGSGTYFPVVNLLQNIDFSGTGYTSDSVAYGLRKCMPDNPTLYVDSHFVFEPPSVVPFTWNAIGVGGVQNIGGVNYYYNGPYRSLNTGLWQISGDAVYGEYGLFTDKLGADVQTGYGSKLFPRYSKLNLSANTQHIAGSTPDGAKTLVTTFPVSGSTNWMDGCNARAATLNPDNNEHIGSCNVSATVEILEKVVSTGEFKLIAGSADGGKEVKLQLVRDSETNTQGNEILYSALNQCENSSACGSNECCFNNRCWSKEIVSICPESAPSNGNLGIGETCTTDFSCSSLCCSPSTGRCEVHNSSLEPPVLCSKPPGQLCIAKEWCMKQTVSECYIVKTGFDQFGTPTCEVRCYNVEKFGNCTNGICTPPVTPSVPVFNPADPNACDSAIDPPY